MSNKKPIPQYPVVPTEEEIEEDLKAIDEVEAPLLSGQFLCKNCNCIYLVQFSNNFQINLDDAKVLLESIGAEVDKNDVQETAEKLMDNVDELEQTILTLGKKYDELMNCEKALEQIEEEIDKQIKEMNKYE